jgi:hypothetical protein
MKLAVYGSCQAPIFASCLKVLLPESHVAGYHVGISPPPENEDSDLIFVHPGVVKRLDMKPDARFRFFPNIVFTGFHPDCIYIVHDKKPVSSPIGVYNSSLVAACFLKNVPERDVPSWFSGSVFEAVGFYREFERSKTFLLDNARSLGLDLIRYFEGWLRREIAFMHTINHPQIYVIYDLCSAALAVEGMTGLSTEGMPRDPLSRGKWPVYSVLATRLRVQEEPLFMFASTMSLPEFVAGSYSIFSGLPREVIANTPAVARVLVAMQKAGL